MGARSQPKPDNMHFCYVFSSCLCIFHGG